MTDPSEVGVSGPLEPLATGFASSLVRQGYTPNSATSQMHLMAHLSRWLAGEGVEARGAPPPGGAGGPGGGRGARPTGPLRGEAQGAAATSARPPAPRRPPPP